MIFYKYFDEISVPTISVESQLNRFHFICDEESFTWKKLSLSLPSA